MKSLITRLGLLGVAAAIAVAAPAAAEEIVPPGNSAATQYTEAYPTAAGEKDALKDKGKGKGNAQKEVLGKDNVKKLQEHGETGEDVAELAAETAPAPIETSPETVPAPSEPREESGGGGGGNSRGGDGNGGGGAQAKQPKSEKPAVNTVDNVVVVEQPEGSSAFGEVTSQAFGAPSSGHLGLLLPLALAGALIWALLYRRRDQER